jgi:hypothetical protein
LVRPYNLAVFEVLGGDRARAVSYHLPALEKLKIHIFSSMNNSPLLLNALGSTIAKIWCQGINSLKAKILKIL